MDALTSSTRELKISLLKYTWTHEYWNVNVFYIAKNNFNSLWMETD